MLNVERFGTKVSHFQRPPCQGTGRLTVTCSEQGSSKPEYLMQFLEVSEAKCTMQLAVHAHAHVGAYVRSCAVCT